MAFVYIFNRFFYRIFQFLRHWYVKSWRIYSNFVINFLERLDKTFALKVTLKNFFQPLYQDYTLLGYLMGFIFRSCRLIIAVVIYGLVLILALGGYLIWVLIPPFLIFKIFS